MHAWWVYILTLVARLCLERVVVARNWFLRRCMTLMRFVQGVTFASISSVYAYASVKLGVRAGGVYIVTLAAQGHQRKGDVEVLHRGSFMSLCLTIALGDISSRCASLRLWLCMKVGTVGISTLSKGRLDRIDDREVHGRASAKLLQISSIRSSRLENLVLITNKMRMV